MPPPESASAGPDSFAANRVITLTSANAGTLICCDTGTTIVLSLDETASSGHSWAVDAVDAHVVSLEDSSFVRPPNDGLGAGTQHVFRFRALGQGTTELRMKLWRQWEGDRSIAERFSVRLQVPC